MTDFVVVETQPIDHDISPSPTPANLVIMASAKNRTRGTKRITHVLNTLYDDAQENLHDEQNFTIWSKETYLEQLQDTTMKLDACSVSTTSDDKGGSSLIPCSRSIQDSWMKSCNGVGELAVDLAENVVIGAFEEEANSSSFETDSSQSDNDIRQEWLGTTPFAIEYRIDTQTAGHLDDLIYHQRTIYDSILETPYDPKHWIELCQCCLTLGFADIAAAAAHKALILIKASLNLDHGCEGIVYPSNLEILTKMTLGERLHTRSPTIIEEELKNLLLICYSGLLSSLLACGTFWEGLRAAKEALSIFPKDVDLLETRNMLRDYFYERQNSLKAGAADKVDESLILMTRVGEIYQVQYPWLDTRLNDRTPALVRELNDNLNSQICEIKPIILGPLRESFDVGPLGIFAMRDIDEGESVLVDKCITNTTDLHPKAQTYCDACHASLLAPHTLPMQIVRPECCEEVAFCSQDCCSTATSGYHRILCGKDWSWTYGRNGRPKSTGLAPDPMWRVRLFLRMVAVYLADTQSTKTKVHPLQHSLFGRMSANYSLPSYPDFPLTHDWYYYENIGAPTRILMTLGINPFTDPHWTQEVIQTIFWKMENNANMSNINLSTTTLPSSNSPQREDSTGEEIVTSINTNYLFLNHSCEPNISWRGPSSTPFESSDSLEGINGEIIKPGSATIICRARQKIKKGEELKISYIGDPMGTSDNTQLEGGRQERRRWLRKWFEGGCGCSICTKEAKEVKAMAAAKSGP
ncbi:hypothetical protein BP6252_02455 [Coleophoma cylindrospora]|uniref:SET domain-containing protein n=1 Tax=Coleophoma cylindrospora TaxID=1849047 RepID=A0A3D8SEU8_9HELO|nr:hypothetical protein BP6252_02455 [Coleophoma cylindrospora]